MLFAQPNWLNLELHVVYDVRVGWAWPNKTYQRALIASCQTAEVVGFIIPQSLCLDILHRYIFYNNTIKIINNKIYVIILIVCSYEKIFYNKYIRNSL